MSSCAEEVVTGLTLLREADVVLGGTVSDVRDSGRRGRARRGQAPLREWLASVEVDQVLEGRLGALPGNGRTVTMSNWERDAAGAVGPPRGLALVPLRQVDGGSRAAADCTNPVLALRSRPGAGQSLDEIVQLLALR